MRVLVANKFWYRRGGLERVMFDEIDWLQQAGHEIAHFSTRHPDNVLSPWGEYFAPYMELGADGGLSGAERVLSASRLFVNPAARRQFARLMDAFEPDIVHIHGIHRQISPSVLFEARSRGIPVVQTLHDYHHVCPADLLLRGGTETCIPAACGRYWCGPAVSNRCVRGSSVASTLSAAETMFQRIRRAYERTVDLFVSPSEFLKRMMLAGGWRIPFEVVPNAVRVANSGRSAPSAEGGYFLFAGRLVREKGVDELVQAAAQLKVPVVVAGDGPLRSELESRNGGARFVGHVDADALGELMRCALCCVVPSTALENAPMSVLEPMAAGVPVIASDVGGVSEIIADGRTGLLVPPGDPSALAAAMSSVLADPDWAEGIGAAARALVTESYSPERHLRLLLSSYERVLDR